MLLFHVSYAQKSFFTVEYKSQYFDVYRVNLRTDTIQLFWKDTLGNRYGSFDSLLINKTLKFATNGGMYMENGAPLGLYIENGKPLVDLNERRNAKGNFYLKPNGVFYLEGNSPKICTTPNFNSKETIRFATQSGPMLVINDTLHPAFNAGSTNKYIRNGVGVRNDSILFFAISNAPVNFYDFAMLFKNKLGCKNALYLDGAISRMYVKNKRKQLGGNFGCIIGVY